MSLSKCIGTRNPTMERARLHYMLTHYKAEFNFCYTQQRKQSAIRFAEEKRLSSLSSQKRFIAQKNKLWIKFRKEVRRQQRNSVCEKRVRQVNSSSTNQQQQQQTQFSVNSLIQTLTISERTSAVMDVLGTMKPLALTRFLTSLLYPKSKLSVLTAIAEFAEVHGWLYTSFSEDKKVWIVESLMQGISNLWGFVKGTPNMRVRQVFNVKDPDKFDNFSGFFKSLGLSGSITQCGVTAACLAVAAALAMIMGVSFTAMANDWTFSVVKKLGNIGNAINGISHLFSKVKIVAEWIFSFVSSFSGIEWLSSSDADLIKIKKDISEAQKLASSLVEVLKADPGQIYWQKDAFERLDHTIRNLQDVVRRTTVSKGNLANCKVHMDALLRDMDTLKEARSTFITNLLPNFNPVCYWLYGIPGAGKTQLNKALMRDIATRFGWGGSVYALNTNCKHVDRYNGQMITGIDDFGHGADNTDHEILQRLVGSEKCHLQMAELDKKGMLFSSRVVAITSNHAYVITSKTVTDTTAVNRRRHYVVEVANPEHEAWVSANSSTPRADDTVNGKPIYTEDFSNLKMRLLRPIPREAESRTPKKNSGGFGDPNQTDYLENGRYITYTELLDMICSKLELHQKDFDAEVRKVLKTVSTSTIAVVVRHLSQIAGLPIPEESTTTTDEAIAECATTFAKLATPNYEIKNVAQQWMADNADLFEIPDTSSESSDDSLLSDGFDISSDSDDSDGTRTREADFVTIPSETTFTEHHEVPKVSISALIGPPGIGKTYLLRGVIRRFREMGLTVHEWCGCPDFDARPPCDIEIVSDLTQYAPHRYMEWLVRTYDGESTPERLPTQLVLWAGNEDILLAQLRQLTQDEQHLITRRVNFRKGFFLPKITKGSFSVVHKIVASMLPWGYGRYSEHDVTDMATNGRNMSELVGYLPAVYKAGKFKLLNMPTWSPDYTALDLYNTDRRWQTHSLFKSLPVIGNLSSTSARLYYNKSMEHLNQFLRQMVTGQDLFGILRAVKVDIDIYRSNWHVLPNWCADLFSRMNVILHDQVTTEELLLSIHNSKIKMSREYNFAIHSIDKTVLIKTDKDLICQCFWLVPGAVLVQQDRLVQAYGTGIKWYRLNEKEKQFYESIDYIDDQDGFRLISARAAKIEYETTSNLALHSIFGDAIDNEIVDQSLHLTNVQSSIHQAVLDFGSCAMLLIQLLIVVGGVYTITNDKKEEYRNAMKEKQSRFREKYVFNPDYDPNWKQNRIQANKLAGKGESSKYFPDVNYENVNHGWEEPDDDDDYDYDQRLVKVNNHHKNNRKGAKKYEEFTAHHDESQHFDTMEDEVYETQIDFDDPRAAIKAFGGSKGGWSAMDDDDPSNVGYDYPEYESSRRGGREVNSAIALAQTQEGVNYTGKSNGNFTVVDNFKNQITIMPTDKWHPDFQQEVHFDGAKFASVRAMYDAQKVTPRQYACLRAFFHLKFQELKEEYPEELLDYRIVFYGTMKDELLKRCLTILLECRKKLRGQPRKKELCADPVLLDVREKVLDNVVDIYYDDTRLLGAIMLGGRIGVTNYHLILLKKQAKRFTMLYKDVKYNIKLLKANPLRDLLVFEVEKTCPAFPKIVQHIPPHTQDIFNERNTGIMVTKQFGTRHPSFTNHEIRFTKRLITVYDDQKIDGYQWVPTAIGFNVTNTMMTRGGDCGSPVFLKNKSYNQKLIGLHSNSGTHDGQCAILFQEDFEEWFPRKKEIYEESTPTKITPLRDEQIELYQDPIAIFNHIKEVGVSKKTLQAQDRADFRRSPFHIEPPASLPSMVPAALSAKDPRLPEGTPNLLMEGLKRFDNETKPVDMQILNYAIQKTADHVANIFRTKGLDVRVLSKEKAINAVTSLSGSHSIQLDSSAGYPFCLESKTEGKKPYIIMSQGGYDGERIINPSPEGKKLNAMVDLMIQYARQGVRTGAVFACGLKSEIVEYKKVHSEPKTRMYMMCPLHLLVATRMYFHTAAAGFSTCRHILPPQIGFNPYGPDYNQMLTRLLAKGPHAIEMDFKSWDSTIPLPFMRGIVEIYNKIYQVCDPNWEEEHDVIRRGLHEHLVSPLFLIHNRIYQVPMGQPSGETNTALTNSLVSMLLLYYCWHKNRLEQKQPADYDLFLEVLDSVNLGDDLLATITPAEREFTDGEKLAKQYLALGMKATSPKDKTLLPEKYVKLTESTFLSRKPYFHDGKYWGVLKPESLLKMMGWTRIRNGNIPSGTIPYTVGEFDIPILTSMVDSILAEFAQMGPNQFAYVKDHLRRCMSLYNFSLEMKTYGEIMYTQGHILRPELAEEPKKDRNIVPLWFFQRWLATHRQPATVESQARVVEILQIATNERYLTRCDKLKQSKANKSSCDKELPRNRQCLTASSPPKSEPEDPVSSPQPLESPSHKVREWTTELYPSQPRTLTHITLGLVATLCQQKLLSGQTNKWLDSDWQKSLSTHPIPPSIMLPTPAGMKHGEEDWTSNSQSPVPISKEERSRWSRYHLQSSLQSSQASPSSAYSPLKFSTPEPRTKSELQSRIKEILSITGHPTINKEIVMQLEGISSSLSSYPWLLPLHLDKIKSICSCLANGTPIWSWLRFLPEVCLAPSLPMRKNSLPSTTNCNPCPKEPSGIGVAPSNSSRFWPHQPKPLQDITVGMVRAKWAEIISLVTGKESLLWTFPSRSSTPCRMGPLTPLPKILKRLFPRNLMLTQCGLQQLSKSLMQHIQTQSLMTRVPQQHRILVPLLQEMCLWVRTLLELNMISHPTLCMIAQPDLSVQELVQLTSESIKSGRVHGTQASSSLLLLQRASLSLASLSQLQDTLVCKMTPPPPSFHFVIQMPGQKDMLCSSMSSIRKQIYQLRYSSYIRMVTTRHPSGIPSKRLSPLVSDFQLHHSCQHLNLSLRTIRKKLQETSICSSPNTESEKIKSEQNEQHSIGNTVSVDANGLCASVCLNTDNVPTGIHLDGHPDVNGRPELPGFWTRRSSFGRTMGSDSFRGVAAAGGGPQLSVCETSTIPTTGQSEDNGCVSTAAESTERPVHGGGVPKRRSARVSSPRRSISRCHDSPSRTMAGRNEHRDSLSSNGSNPFQRAVFELSGTGQLHGCEIAEPASLERLSQSDLSQDFQEPIQSDLDETDNTMATSYKNFYAASKTTVVNNIDMLTKDYRIKLLESTIDWETFAAIVKWGNITVNTRADTKGGAKKIGYEFFFDFFHRNGCYRNLEKRLSTKMYYLEADMIRIDTLLNMKLEFSVYSSYGVEVAPGVDVVDMVVRNVPEPPPQQPVAQEVKPPCEKPKKRDSLPDSVKPLMPPMVAKKTQQQTDSEEEALRKLLGRPDIVFAAPEQPKKRKPKKQNVSVTLPQGKLMPAKEDDTKAQPRRETANEEQAACAAASRKPSEENPSFIEEQKVLFEQFMLFKQFQDMQKMK